MWLYNDEEFVLQEDSDWYGFVYVITNMTNGMKYVGKKFFWSKRILPITKSRKRRKHTLKESDWMTYFGSSKHLVEDMETDEMHREIIHLCKSKGECAYMEAQEQFDREVLLRDDYYNGIINCRIGGPSVRGMKRVKTSS